MITIGLACYNFIRMLFYIRKEGWIFLQLIPLLLISERVYDERGIVFHRRFIKYLGVSLALVVCVFLTAKFAGINGTK